MVGIDAHRRNLDRESKVLVPWLELSPRSQDPVRPPSQRRGKFDFVSKTRNKRNDRARHICVDRKAHDALSGGKWVKKLLLGKLADESERRSNIINSQIVLTLNFFKGHPPGEAPNHDRHWNTRTTNDGFPVANSRIYNDAVPRLHGDPNSTDFAQLVEISVDCLPHLSEGSSEFWPSTLPSQVWLR